MENVLIAKKFHDRLRRCCWYSLTRLKENQKLGKKSLDREGGML